MVLVLVFKAEFRDKCSFGVLVGIPMSERYGYILDGEYDGSVCLFSGVEGSASQM